MTEARITPFLFEGEHTIREVDFGGSPRFVGKDVAAALGYKDTVKAVSTHCKHGQPIGEGETPPPVGLDPQTIVIPEGDVYRLVLRSKLPAAERFEAWLMEEVLPSLRRTGRYETSRPFELHAYGFDHWSSEELRTRNSTVTMYRQTMNNPSAVWMMERLGFPMPPNHLLPAWRQQPEVWEPKPANSLTIVVGQAA